MMDGRFNRAHEPCAHVYTLRAQRQCRSETLSICESTRCDKGDFQRLSRSAQEDEIRNIAFADVARAFEAVDGEEVDAEFDGGLGVSDRGAFVQDGAAGGFQLFDYRAGTVACCFDDADSAVDYRLCVAWFEMVSMCGL